MSTIVQKASGETEPFDASKLRVSLTRAGAPGAVATRVTERVAGELSNTIDSAALYERTVRALTAEHALAATRYGLKRAVMRLGPAGYRFEQYVAALLEAEGYTTAVGQLVQGACVQHEVDVLARRGAHQVLVECKFHQQPGTRSDIKVALYTHARFLDVTEGLRERGGHADTTHEAWLVTNTKCTVDALRYAQCRGLRILAWRTPHDRGLEALIERHGLYPVTILPSVTPAVLERFGRAGVVTVHDLMIETEATLSTKFALKRTTAHTILSDAHSLASA